MKKLIELLTQADAEAKRLADENPANAMAQILRARTRSALDFAESPACLPAAGHRPALPTDRDSVSRSA